MPETPVIVMVGTDLRTQGGISAVVEVLKAGGLFKRCGVEYVASHCDGSIASRLMKAASGWARFAWVLLRRPVAGVHIHIASDGSFWRKLLFFLTARIWRVPIVLHLHGAEFHLFYERSRVPWMKQLIRHLFESAHTVIVLSKSWQVWVRSRFPDANACVVYNPVVLPPQIPSDRREKATLLFLGRVGERKGTYDLIDALAKVLLQYPHARLLLGGDGDLDAARQRAGERGVASHVEILGWVRGDDKRQLLDRATVYVLPSYNEGLPMSVLEAMASGIPVVTTTVGGIPEAVANGIEGYLVEAGDVDALADRLVSLLNDSELRRRMGEAARQRVESTFSVECVVPMLEKIYATLGRGRRASTPSERH